jgi:hypothetical protein
MWKQNLNFRGERIKLDAIIRGETSKECENVNRIGRRVVTHMQQN